MSLSPSIPQPGDVIAGKYQVVSVLGAGDTNIVLQAELPESGEQVALHRYAFGPAGRHARALAEARQSALAHLPQRCGFRVIETLDPLDAHYLVTAWQAGESLDARLTRVGPQPIAEVGRLLLPCIRAAHTAHLAGIVHHAIKDSTIYVCEGTGERAEHAKLLDFELDPARALQPLASRKDTGRQRRVTVRTGRRATEAQRARRVDPRSAVRAFGAIMYRALTGRRHSPFEAAAGATASGKAAPPPLLPPIVRWFVERALSDACEEPFQSLEQMAEALDSMTAALPEVSVRSPEPVTVPPASNVRAASAFKTQPMGLLPSTFTPGAVPNAAAGMPGGVKRPWATTMRLPRVLYDAPKTVPARLPLAWIIAAVALVFTAGALSLRHDPHAPASADEDVVVSYNAATAAPSHGLDQRDWRERDPLPVPLPAAALPLAALAPQPTAASTSAPIVIPVPKLTPPAAVARAGKPLRTHAAAAAAARAVSKVSVARAPNVERVDRGARSPGRVRAPIPRERPPLTPATYPRPAPSTRPAPENGALDSMGLL